jgi:hypothetical protein
MKVDMEEIAGFLQGWLLGASLFHGDTQATVEK